MRYKFEFIRLIGWILVAYTREDENGEPHGVARPQWWGAFVEYRNLLGCQSIIMKRVYKWVKAFVQPIHGFKEKREPNIHHERVARIGHRGRVLLAGEALHSNNQTGRLGLSS